MGVVFEEARVSECSLSPKYLDSGGIESVALKSQAWWVRQPHSYLQWGAAEGGNEGEYSENAALSSRNGKLQ